MRTTFILVIAMALPLMAQAQQAPLEAATEEALIEALSPPPPPQPASRGIKLTQAAPASVDLAVEFAYDSAVLTEQAKQQLAALGGALSSDALSGYRFTVAGHTDAVGSDAYNQVLSLARAQSVRTFLWDAFEIAPARLDVLGHGETRLLFPDAPEDGRNRRVEITTQQ